MHGFLRMEKDISDKEGNVWPCHSAVVFYIIGSLKCLITFILIHAV